MIIVTIIKLVLFIFHVKSALFIQAALDICENLHRVSSFKYLAERKGLFSPNAGRGGKARGILLQGVAGIFVYSKFEEGILWQRNRININVAGEESLGGGEGAGGNPLFCFAVSEETLTAKTTSPPGLPTRCLSQKIPPVSGSLKAK